MWARLTFEPSPPPPTEPSTCVPRGAPRVSDGSQMPGLGCECRDRRCHQEEGDANYLTNSRSVRVWILISLQSLSFPRRRQLAYARKLRKYGALKRKHF